MKILVTGCNGTIGFPLSEFLANSGHEVTGVDKEIHQCGVPKGIEFIQMNVAEYSAAVIPKFDVIFHLASEVDARRYVQKYQNLVDCNVIAVTNLVRHANMTGARLIYSSTSEVYGTTDDPITEENPGVIHQNHPRSIYGNSKRLGESIINAHCHNFGILRLFNVYSSVWAAEDTRIIPELFRCAQTGKKFRIFGDGFATRSYVNVRDAITMIMHVVFSKKNDTWNIGVPELNSVQHVLSMFRELHDIDFEYGPDLEPGETVMREPVLDKFEKDFFSFRGSHITLQEGLNEIYQQMSVFLQR